VTHPLLLLLVLLVQPAPKVGAPPDNSNTVSASITLRDVDLGELISKLKVEVKYAVAGKVTVKASVSVPLGDATSSKAYTVRGSVTSAELKLENLTLRDLSADVVYANGKLTLTELRGALPPDDPADKPGEFRGTATAAIDPPGDVTADLTLTRLPLGQVFGAIPGGVPVSGGVSGKAQFRAPYDKLSDPATWVASADLSGARLSVFQRAVRDAEVTLGVKDGKATLTDTSAVVEGVPVAGDGSVTLSGKYPYTASIRTRPQEVAELQKLVPELEVPVAIRGKLDTTSTVRGTASPFTVSAAGNLTVTDFAVGDTPADKLNAKWEVTPDRVTVSDLSAGAFRGTVTGSASFPLAADKTGEFKLVAKGVDAAAAAKAFPKVPVKLTGVVSGDVTGKLPEAKGDQPRAVTADVNLSAPRLTVQGIPAEKLTGKLSLDGTAVKYELEGKTLGGSFDVKGRYPEAKADDKDKEDGSVHITELDLSRLAEALGLNVRLRGVVSLSFRYSADLSEGDGWYTVRGLGTMSQPLIPNLSGRLRLRNGNFEVLDTVGPVSAGTIRARVRASLSDPARNFYRLDVDRIDVSRLLAAFGGPANLVEGGVTLTARGKLWPEFRATGIIALTRGRIAGLAASDVRVPYQLAVRSGGGEINLREFSGTVGNGRVAGGYEYQWGVNGRASGQIKFTNVTIGSVLSDLKQSNYFGNARVTGRIDIRGENMRSSDDLTGSVVATIDQAAVRDLPVLSAITPFVPPTALLKPFDSGELRGRLSRGVFTVERLTLASPNADLYADGTVTLAGRLDLGVIVRTGTLGLNDSLLQQLGLSIPLPIAPLPLTVIRDVSVFLSNRTVRLNITGTVARPQPQLNTAALITDEAIRFFLRRYLPTAAAVIPEVSPRSRR
jgi:translocation and assembly module TamB